MGCKKNPQTKSFTWSQKSPFVFCRLDYWLISNSLQDLIKDADIIAAIRTDHSAILLHLQELEECKRGPGFWKMNTSILTDKIFVQIKMKEKLLRGMEKRGWGVLRCNYDVNDLDLSVSNFYLELLRWTGGWNLEVPFPMLIIPKMLSGKIRT